MPNFFDVARDAIESTADAESDTAEQFDIFD
jgi:hypothetical protein